MTALETDAPPSSEEIRAAIETYIHSGPGDGAAIRANIASWRALPLHPRVLRDISVIETRTALLGLESPIPVLAAPWAAHGLVHEAGERETAAGLAAAGIPMVQSSSSTVPVQEVAQVSGPFWQQVYVPQDRTLIDGFLDRAVEAGATALVLTVDQPAAGNTLPFRAGLARALAAAGSARMRANFPELPPGAPLGSATDLGAADIARLRSRTGLPVIVKGVLRTDDARAAVAAGASAIIVSNHGGRQLAGSVTPAEVLPRIADAVGAEVPVLADGGLRDGEDVVRALALGARAVLIGRPVARALEQGGADAVARWGRELVEDVRRVFALCGIADPADATRDLITGG